MMSFRFFLFFFFPIRSTGDFACELSFASSSAPFAETSLAVASRNTRALSVLMFVPTISTLIITTPSADIKHGS